MAACCRSRRSLFASIAALSLVCYYVGSSVLWADIGKKDSDSNVSSSKLGQEGQIAHGGQEAADSDQSFRDVKCTGAKCDKYMKLLGLAKSGERSGTTKQYCKYLSPRLGANAQSGAPSANDIASLQTCRDATSLERLVSVVDDAVTVARPSAADPVLRCELDAVRRGEDDNSVTYERTALLDSAGAATAASLKGADFHRLTCHVDANSNQVNLNEEKSFVRYFAHINRNEEAVKDARDATCKNCLGYNVLILGVDALSRSNFQQYLPHTMDYLTTKMDAVILRGYTTVGQSNGGTLIPMLTGQHESELPEARRGKIDSHYTDEFDIIWKEYERNGYATLFAEDEPDRSTFNAYYHGFEMEPTNHYMRPFWLAAAKGMPGSRSASESKYCLGARMRHQLAFDYVADFFDEYKDLKKFAFLHHNGLSSDDTSHVRHMDFDLGRLLLSLRDKGHLEKTVVIVMSDHGSKDGKPSAGPKQRVDARSPMLLISLPPAFRKQYETQASSVEANAGRLTTPYDVHATLRDLLDSRRLKRDGGAAAATAAARGTSLFADVALNRTCASAAVDPHWCTCADHRQLPADDGRSRRAAEAVVDAVNSATERHRQQCAPLSVQRVLECQWLVLNEQADAYEERTGKALDDGASPFDESYLQLAVVTSPSSAVFEATVLHDRLKGTFTLTAAGAIRVSAVPEASRHCLDDPAAMHYCECR